MPNGFLKILGIPLKGVFQGIESIIDATTTTAEEKAEAKAKILALQMQAQSDAYEAEQAWLREQSAVVQAEAKSEMWITAAWRPIAMLFFIVVVGFAIFTGGVVPWSGQVIPQEYVQQALSIVKIGLTGYIVGRSAEKITRDGGFTQTVRNALGGKNE